MEKYADAIKSLEKLLWDFGLSKAIARIQVVEGDANTSPALHCIVERGNSSKVIATVFDEYDYRPKYVVIRERFQQSYPEVEVNYLI